MADVSRYGATMTDHPDMIEMRERYERISGSPPVVLIDGLVLLAGLWLAISPWVVRFNTVAPNVTVNNLVLGLAVTVVALGLTMMPQHMARLSWATAVIGTWVIVSHWVIQRADSSVGIAINNVITGAITLFLGVAAAAILMTGARTDRR